MKNELVRVENFEGMENRVDDLVSSDESEMGSSSSSSSSILSPLFGSTDPHFLLSPTESQVKTSDLEGKILAIYFAANWWRPCHHFTRVLAKAYEPLKNKNPSFEIVFVSSDEDQSAFDQHRASMPWPAISFSNLIAKRALNRMFDVEAMPSLVILQPDCSDKESAIVDGVDRIYQYGSQAYPFTKDRLDELMRLDKARHENQTLQDLLTNHERDFLLSHSKPNQVPVAALIGKTIGLYFSAQWCSPAIKFTAKLVSVYQKIKQETAIDGKQGFEIVYVSSDHSQTSFDTYFHNMPWRALPYGDPKTKGLAKYFDVRGIPILVILGPDGKTVTKSGRKLVNLYEEKAYPFTGPRIELLKRRADEEARKLPETEYHSGHRHKLTLVSEGNGGGDFICCDCDEQGAGWAYQCMGCGYEVHPKCVRPVL